MVSISSHVVVEIVCVALYLRGAPRSGSNSKQSWPAVESTLLREGSSLSSVASDLRRSGLSDVATALEERRLLAWAEDTVTSGKAMGRGSNFFPARWHCAAGPLAAWVCGSLPTGKWAAVVGTRSPSPAEKTLAESHARSIARQGLTLVTGGATGVDAAGAAASEAVLILPYGLDHYCGTAAAVSVCAPWEPFSTANAMERNSLIYLAGEYAVAIGARFGEGGTWHGAVTALRKRLTEVRVPQDGSRASQALINLGAVPLPSCRCRVSQNS